MNPAVALAPVCARDRFVIWITAALASLYFLIVCAPILPYSRQHDFVSFYAAGELARQGRFAELYRLDAMTEVEKALVPDLAVPMPFIRPAVFALLFSPLTLLPFDTAFAVFLGGQVVLLGAVWWWACRRLGQPALLFASLFLPAAFGIAHSQDCVVMMLVTGLAWLALERGREIPAGVLLGLALVKFHLFVLMAPAMLLRRRWKMFGAYSATGGLMAAVSLAVIGRVGFDRYIAQMTSRDIGTLSPSPERMVNVHALFNNLGIENPWPGVIVAIAVAGFALAAVKRSSGEGQWFWIAVAGSLLLPPHVYQYDVALLFPALLTGVMLPDQPRYRLVRISSALTILPVSYLCVHLGKPWAMAPAVVVLLWFAAASTFALRGHSAPRAVAQ